VPPANWHFTLRFLGELESARAEQIAGALAATVLRPPFGAELAGLGAFPSASRARTLWLGLSRGAAEFSRLAAAVDLALTACGVGTEVRPFSCHLTLARLDRPADLSRLIAGHPVLPVPFSVEAVMLFRSDLGGGPPRYTALERFPLHV
jgi:2'-5' RNA ligase